MHNKNYKIIIKYFIIFRLNFFKFSFSTGRINDLYLINILLLKFPVDFRILCSFKFIYKKKLNLVAFICFIICLNLPSQKLICSQTTVFVPFRSSNKSGWHFFKHYFCLCPLMCKRSTTYFTFLILSNLVDGLVFAFLCIWRISWQALS